MRLSRDGGPDDDAFEFEELPLVPDLEPERLPRRGFKLPSMRRFVRPLAIGVAVIVLATVTWSSGWGQEHLAGRPQHVFSHRTGDVLLFNDGRSGTVLVDLDKRVVVRRYIDREIGSALSAQFMKDDKLIIASGQGTIALDLKTGRRSVLAPGAGVLPAFEKNRLWVFDLLSNRPSFEYRPQTVKETDLQGRILWTYAGPNLPYLRPADAIPDGVVFFSSDGLTLFDAPTGRTRTIRVSDPTLGISSARSFVWCSAACREMHIAQKAGHDVVAHAPGRFVFDATEGFLRSRISGDNRYVAVPYGDKVFSVSAPLNQEVLAHGSLALIDARTGKLRTVGAIPGNVQSVHWSPDGRRVYTLSVRRSRTWISVFDLDARTFETRFIPLNPEVFAGAAIRRGLARRLLAGVGFEKRSLCGPLEEQPSPEGNPAPPCAFRF